MSRAAVSLRPPSRVEPAEHQRADAVRVAGGVQGVLVHEDEAERAAQVREHLERGRLEGAVRIAGEQRGHQRRVGGVAPAQLAARPARRTARRRVRAARACS